MARMHLLSGWKSVPMVLLAVVALGIGVNAALRKTYVHEKPGAPRANTVTATGTYVFGDDTVNVTMHAPLERGAVSGFLSGACEGTIEGITRGDGRISATVSGICKRFLLNIPLQGTIDGAISLENKSIMIAFEGKSGGFTLKDEITLVYP